MTACAFGRFTLELETGEIRKDGRPVKLHPQPAAVLRLLAQRPGVVVSRDEIQKELWPDDTHVDFDLGINSCIKQIRTALEDDADRPRYVETIPRQGYRFVAPIEVTQETVERQKMFFNPRVWAVLTLLALGIGAAALLTLSPAPEQPTRSDAIPLTSFPGDEIDPALSPDGHQVAFAWNGSEDDRFHIYVQMIDGDAPLQLTRADSDDFTPAWSPDGNRIAFLRQRPDEITSEILIVPVLGGREQTLTTIQVRREVGPLWEPGLDWSPDGRYLVTADRASFEESAGITLVSVETAEKRRITHPPADGVARDNHPRFSPDGRQVAFLRQTGPGYHAVYSVPLEGGDAEQLVSGVGHAVDLDWTDDASALLFVKNKELRWNIWKVALGTADPSRLNFGDDAWSTTISGNRLVFEEGHRINCDIWRLPGPTAEVRIPPEPLLVSARMDMDANFSPDGKKIAFLSGRLGLAGIWICTNRGSDCFKLTTMRSGWPSWSADGKRIAHWGRDGERWEIYVTDVETKISRPLTGDDARGGLWPSWSRDGRWVYYSSNRTGTMEIWKMPVEGGETLQVTQGGGEVALEGDDGFVYFAKRRQPSSYKWIDLCRIPVDGGVVSPVLADLFVESRNWTLWRDHIVYRHWVNEEGIPEAGPDSHSVMDMMNLETGEVTRLHTFDPGDSFCFGHAVSPDGLSILYAPQVSPGGHDLVLVDNYN